MEVDILTVGKSEVNKEIYQHHLIWDRCYDFLNIFAEKLSDKIAVFDSKQS
jgi:hypothetical protein